MSAKIPANVREKQINELQNISFVRWAGVYKDAHSKAVCRCLIDGFEWVAAVSSLLRIGTGCPQCSGKRRWTFSERMAQINALPNICFVRWVDVYKNVYSKAVCRCEVDGFEWKVSVDQLLNAGTGCPRCSKTGFNPALPATLYILRSECGSMVKIGISNDYVQRHKTLKSKTPFDWSCVELIHGDGALVASAERGLHELTERLEFVEKFDGHTEWRRWDSRLPLWLEHYRRNIEAR